MPNKTKDKIDLTEIIEASKEKLKDAVIESTIEELKKSLSWRISNDAEEIVKKFMNEEIKPEIEKKLIERKLEIIASLDTGLAEIGKGFAEKVKSLVTEKISKMSDYEIREIIKATF